MTAPEGGLFVWVTLPDGYDAEAILPRALERGVAFVPGKYFYAGEAVRRRCASPSPPRRPPSCATAPPGWEPPSSRRWNSVNWEPAARRSRSSGWARGRRSTCGRGPRRRRRRRPRRRLHVRRLLADVRRGGARARAGSRRPPRRGVRGDQALDARRRRGRAPGQARAGLVRRPRRPLPGAQPRRTARSGWTCSSRCGRGHGRARSARRTTARRRSASSSRSCAAAGSRRSRSPTTRTSARCSGDILPLAEQLGLGRDRDAPAGRRPARPPRHRTPGTSRRSGWRRDLGAGAAEVRAERPADHGRDPRVLQAAPRHGERGRRRAALVRAGRAQARRQRLAAQLGDVVDGEHINRVLQAAAQQLQVALVGADGELEARVRVGHRQHLRAAALADAEHAQQDAGARRRRRRDSRVTDEGATPGGRSSMGGPFSSPNRSPRAYPPLDVPQGRQRPAVLTAGLANNDGDAGGAARHERMWRAAPLLRNSTRPA